MITEQDDDRFFAQLIHKKLNELGTAEASIRCNRKGSDYFKYITIEPLYTDA